MRITHLRYSLEEPLSVDYFSTIRRGVFEQPFSPSKRGRDIFQAYLLVVNLSFRDYLVLMEIILTCLWQLTILVFLILVGYVLKGRRNDRFLPAPYRSEGPLLPDRIGLLRRKTRRSSFKRFLSLD